MKRNGDGGVKIEGLGGGKLCGAWHEALINNRRLLQQPLVATAIWTSEIFNFSPRQISDHNRALIRIYVFRDQQGYFAFLYIQISTS